jgi:hypothetical protein
LAEEAEFQLVEEAESLGSQFQIIGQENSKEAKEQNLKGIDIDIPKKDGTDLQIESLKFFH